METTLRALEAKDVFLMSKIIGAIGVNEFKDALGSEKVLAVMSGNGNAAAVGVTVFFDVADVVFKHLPACEKDVYKFLAGLSGLKDSEVAALPMNDFVGMVVDVIKKEEFKDFIKVVSKLFK